MLQTDSVLPLRLCILVEQVTTHLGFPLRGAVGGFNLFWSTEFDSAVTFQPESVEEWLTLSRRITPSVYVASLPILSLHQTWGGVPIPSFHRLVKVGLALTNESATRAIV